MSPRPRLSLDGQWNFFTSPISSTDTFYQITVPAPWQSDGRFRNHTGPAWYQRTFELPAEWLKKDRVIILGFGAVDYYAEVWLNDV